jgi:phage shock protein PspC (stress-responsive transcriptional regulator)
MHEVIRIGWCAVIVCGFCLVAMVFAYFFASWFEDVEKNSKWFEEEGYEG